MMILKVIVLLVALCWSAFLGYAAFDFTRGSVVISLAVFCIVLLAATAPIWLVRFGKKDEKSVAIRKKLNVVSVISSMGIATLRYLPNFLEVESSIGLMARRLDVILSGWIYFTMVFFGIYLSGIILLKIQSSLMGRCK